MVILVVAVTLASCNKAPEQANYIPKDANVVLTVDVKSIGLKSMDFKEFFSLNNFKKALSAKDSSAEKLKNSGIDLLNTAFAFGNINEEKNSYGGVIVALSDKDKFEQFVQGHDHQFNITTDGDYKIAISESEKNGVVVWDSKTALFYFQGAETGLSSKDKALSILKTKKEESLAANDKNFATLLKQNADISFWMNFEKLGKLAQAYSPTTAPVNFKDTYLTAACNFEKGQVLINTKYHANKEISEKLNFAKDNISKDLASVVPGKSLVGLFGLALDMNKFYTYLNTEKLLAGVEPQANEVSGMSAKELFGIFSGEIVGSLNGAVMKEVKTFNYMTGEDEMKKQPSPEFSILLGIADKEKSAKLLASLAEKGIIAKKDNYYVIAEQFYLIDKGSYVAIVPESMKQEIIDNGGEKLASDQSDLLTKNSFGMYVGLKNVKPEILEQYGASVSEWVSKTPLESITLTSGALKNQLSEGKCIVNFKEKEQNSLVTIAKMSDDLGSKVAESTYEPTEALPADTTNAASEVPAEEETYD